MKDLKVNIKFSYLYRDENNFKEFGFKVFSNPDKIKIDLLEKQFRSKLIDFEYFYPNEWNIKPFIFHDFIQNNYWYEFEKLEYTNEDITANETIKGFIEKIQL